MTFKLRYQMSSGTAVRIVDTPAEAVSACATIRRAGGRTTSIVDQHGRSITIDELVALADTALHSGASRRSSLAR